MGYTPPRWSMTPTRPLSAAWSAMGVEPEHPHPAGGRAPVALERLDGGRLAGPVRPEHDEHLAAGSGQVDAVDRSRCAGGPVAHGEAGDLDSWHGVAGYFEQE